MAHKKLADKSQAEHIVAPEDAANKAGPDSFPIIGIGASAGGLEAFENFFRHVAPDCGMAFVLVPHLDPSHASILDEILQRTTSLPVNEARDQVALLPNNVYIIPPNRDMVIFHSTLQLTVPEQPRGQRMPIDLFMRSLAEDQAEKAIGIIFSGTGTDGTLGLRAIHGAGGVCMVQEPDSAKYDGMPQSVIQAGYATHILAVEAMPKMLHDLVLHRRFCPVSLPTQKTAVLNSLNQIFIVLRSGTGHDFSQYKRSTVSRRIERRMVEHEINDIAVYVRFLKENPIEQQALFNELLINVTSFFRDPEAFVALKQEVLPQLLANKPINYEFRAWVAGCSTGEEAYSIAILLRELMQEERPDLKVQIYATDLSESAIAVARAGRYPPNIVQDVLPERLQRFFLKEDDGYYRVNKEVREKVIFAVHSVIKDPPFSKLDLLSCRNVLIYLEPELQNRLLLRFHSALKPDGAFFLSASESITHHPELFPPINRKWKLFRAAHTAATQRSALSDALVSWQAEKNSNRLPLVPTRRPPPLNVAELTHRVLLQSYAPASVLTDLQGNILYVHGETAPYLHPAPGHATLNVIDMAREELQGPLRAAILGAVIEGEPSQGPEVSLKRNGSFSSLSFRLRVVPVPNASECLLLISFQEVPSQLKPKRRSLGEDVHQAQRAEELERELAYNRQNLQATIESQQATNEELKSTNEEMQSTNEELQSSNEELETSREELQSLNEELITVNAELQAKIEQLNIMQNDMKNLLDNINVATIFLDGKLRVRRFTHDALQLYRLQGSDIGRPLRDINSRLKGADLLAQAQRVLDTLLPYECEMVAEEEEEEEEEEEVGGNFLVRIQPYRTLDNMIDGVVLTFTDISKRVSADSEAKAHPPLPSAHP